MDNLKNDEYYLNKILDYIDFAIDSVSNVTKEEFNNNNILINAIMFSFIQISEYSNKLSNEFKMNKSNVPWGKIKGIRNVIVHNYDIVDTEIVYFTVINDFPNLKKKLKKVSHSFINTMLIMHSDAQFDGSSSFPAHVEMMGLIGMGNNYSGWCNSSCSCI